MPEGEMYERMEVLNKLEKASLSEKASIGTMTNHDVAALLRLASKLTAENIELKAQLKDKEIAFECVKAMLKTYMDFVEALDPNAKAYEKAMQKMKKK